MAEIQEIVVGDWKDLNDLEIAFPSDVFRGQSNATWEVTTSLHRALIHPKSGGQYSNSEFWMLRDFKRKARNYTTDLPDTGDTIGWLSLMQHYGAPTRLIDFTRSFYVACYFALKGANSYAVIWCVNPIWLLEEAHKTFKLKKGKLRDEWEDDVFNASNNYLGKILGSASAAEDSDEINILSGSVPVEPVQRNIRLGAQQGLFILLFDVSDSFESSLSSLECSVYSGVRKIILKQKMHNDAIGHLREMNITAETLFPGINGLAQSLLHKHEGIL